MGASSDDIRGWYAGVQKAVRSQAGKGLAALLRRWRYTRSSEFVKLEAQPGATRFLIRYGLLDAGQDADARRRSHCQLIQRAARATGDAPGVVANWLELFAQGQYGVLPQGICDQEPRCGICPLKGTCRFLAAGASDTRFFGKSLATVLTEPGAADSDPRAADLLAFVLSGERCGAADIARAEALLKEYNGLRGLFAANLEALERFGLDHGAQARLRAATRLCRCWVDERRGRGQAFTCGRDFYDFYHLRLRDLKKEVFIVAMLDQKHRLLGDEHVSEGSLTETLVHPREVFSPAIEMRAAAITLIHNHPSGDPMPSTTDKALTQRLESVSKLVGIRLLDHVVIGDGRYVSFVEKRWLQ